MNCPHWLLALTIPFSRSDRAHTSPAGVGAGCAKGLFQTICSPESLLRLPEGLGGPFRRECHPNRRATERQRVPGGQSPRVSTRGPALPIIVAGGRHRVVAGGEPPSACHPVLEAQRAFRPPPCRQPGRLRGRAPPVDALDLPHVTTMRQRHHEPPLLHGRDRTMTPHRYPFPLLRSPFRSGLSAGRRRQCRAPRTASASPPPPLCQPGSPGPPVR